MFSELGCEGIAHKPQRARQSAAPSKFDSIPYRVSKALVPYPFQIRLYLMKNLCKLIEDGDRVTEACFALLFPIAASETNQHIVFQPSYVSNSLDTTVALTYAISLGREKRSEEARTL